MLFDNDSDDNASTCSSPALDLAMVLERARAADRRPYPMVRTYQRLLPLGALHEDPREDDADHDENGDTGNDTDTVPDDDYNNDENRSCTHDFFGSRGGSEFGAESPCFSFASSSSSTHFTFDTSPQLRAPPPPRPSTAMAAYSTPSPTSSGGSSDDMIKTRSISAPLAVPNVPMPLPTVLPLQPISIQQQPEPGPAWPAALSTSFRDAPCPAAPQAAEPPSPTNSFHSKQKPSLLTKLSILASTVSGAPKTPRSPPTASPVPRRSTTSMDRPYFRTRHRFRRDPAGTPDSSRAPSSASLTYAGSAYSPSPRQSGLLSASISSDNLKVSGSFRREGGGSAGSGGGRVAVFLEKLKNFQKRKDGIARRGGGVLASTRKEFGSKGWDATPEFGEHVASTVDTDADMEDAAVA
ncbi:hypothetical protein HDU82_005094 [Entophlyctis luteolus]|nr:hypothetical protein HDU82_005094 [Entophlyctis luteolus]